MRLRTVRELLRPLGWQSVIAVGPMALCLEYRWPAFQLPNKHTICEAQSGTFPEGRCLLSAESSVAVSGSVPDPPDELRLHKAIFVSIHS